MLLLHGNWLALVLLYPSGMKVKLETMYRTTAIAGAMAKMVGKTLGFKVTKSLDRYR